MNALKIAFVANTKNPNLYRTDPAFIYRCENLALALKQLGHEVTFMHVSELSFNQSYDVLVIHRPKAHWLTSWQLSWFRKKGAKIIADFDDLVFSPEWAHVSPGVLNGLVTLKQTKRNFSKHQKALNYCDAILVSVHPLVNKMQLLTDKPIFLLHNTVHMSWYSLDECLDRNTIPRLTYFPGTKSHDKDFALITPVLEQLLSEEPELQLHITGVLSTNIKCRSEQLFMHPKQPFADYAKHVAKSWLNLAPLENTEFNNHKSALKAIEAAWFNVSTLASPIPDMLRLENAGAILMNSKEDWYKTIKQNLTKPQDIEKSSLRERIQAAGTATDLAKSFIRNISTL